MTLFTDFINSITDFIGNTISGLLMTAAVAAFLFTVVKFIWNRSSGKSGDGLKDAKSQLGWSIIGLFVMFSIWGIISFLQSGLFGKDGAQNQIQAPSVKANFNVGQGSGSNSGSGNAAASGASSAPGSASQNGSKKEGDACTPLAGALSECAAGLVCKRSEMKCVRVIGINNAGAGRGGNAVPLGGACQVDAQCGGALLCNSEKVCTVRVR